MSYADETPYDFSTLDRGRLVRRTPLRRLAGAAALTLSLSAGGWFVDAAVHDLAEVPAPALAADTAPETDRSLRDLAFSLGPTPVELASIAPLGPDFAPVSPVPPEPVVEADIVPVPPPDESVLVQDIPLPMPRPSSLRPWPGQGPVRVPGRPIIQASRAPIPPTAPPDNRNFLEKLFGIGRPSAPGLAYAPADDGVFGNARRLTSGPAVANDRWTAIYDIAAHTVYMPNGTRLEAHSGLGERLDDPRHVSDRNRGATPPNVYELQPREQLFHGVQALRLNPVGGEVYGRTGLLAHTYMLGPNGDSNGCVSFRNYNAFLQAYMNGEVKRLVVVARLG